MQLCTPIVTRSKIDHLKRNIANQLYPDFEMEVTPCAKTYNRPNKTSQFYPSQPTSSISAIGVDKVVEEVGYSVIETEEILSNENINDNEHSKSNELHFNCKPQTQWLFIDHILKGFDNPQRYN